MWGLTIITWSAIRRHLAATGAVAESVVAATAKLQHETKPWRDAAAEMQRDPVWWVAPVRVADLDALAPETLVWSVLGHSPSVYDVLDALPVPRDHLALVTNGWQEDEGGVVIDGVAVNRALGLPDRDVSEPWVNKCARLRPADQEQLAAYIIAGKGGAA